MNFSRYRPFLRIIGYVVLFLLSQLVACFAVCIFYGGTALISGELPFEEIDSMMYRLMMEHGMEILLVSYFFVFIWLLILARREKQSLLAFTGMNRPSKPAVLILAVICGIAATFWMTIAVSSIPWPKGMMAAYEENASILTASTPILTFLAAVIFGPLVEEVLFRGLIYDAFCQMIPAGAAVIFQGVLFGGTHDGIVWMIYASFMGIILGYVRKRTGSIWPGVAMHMAFNGGSYLFDIFAERYAEDGASLTIMFLVSAFVMILTLYGINFRTGKEKNEK